MKNLLFFGLIIGALCSCSSPKSSPSTQDITTEQAKELMSKKENLILLDVRTPEEWAQGIIDGAVKINFYENDFADKVKLLDNSQPVLIYCRSGGRSANATPILEEAGFTEIYNLLGGYNDYSSKE